MRKRYAMAIYIDRTDVPQKVFESNEPFLPIHHGELIRPIGVDDTVPSGKILRVVGIEHSVGEWNNVFQQKILIYTTTVDETANVHAW